MKHWATLIATCLAGCGGGPVNAVLEMEVELPGDPAERNALVQVRSGEADFAETWPFEGDVEGFPLTLTRQTVRVSIVAGEDTAGRPFRMKVRLCNDTRCEGEVSAPEVQLHVERGHWLGEHTFLTVTIDEPPGRIVRLPDVSACEVRGCSDDVLATYCDEAGRHACDL